MYETYVTPTDALFYILFVLSIYIAPKCFGVISRHLQEADTNASIKLTAIKQITISVHRMWYQRCRILWVVVNKTVYINML